MVRETVAKYIPGANSISSPFAVLSRGTHFTSSTRTATAVDTLRGIVSSSFKNCFLALRRPPLILLDGFHLVEGRPRHRLFPAPVASEGFLTTAIPEVLDKRLLSELTDQFLPGSVLTTPYSS
jgi:hypothetical protein